jgi:hypothetical protein
MSPGHKVVRMLMSEIEIISFMSLIKIKYLLLSSSFQLN